MKDYTDYYAFHWQVLDKPLTYVRSTLQLLPALGITYLLFEFLVSRTALELHPDFRPALITFYRYLAIGVLVVFSIIGYQIRQKMGQRLSAYSLDKQGLHINHKTIPYHRLDVKAILNQLNKDSASFPVKTNPLITTKIPVKNEQIRSKIINTLDHYTTSK